MGMRIIVAFCLSGMPPAALQAAGALSDGRAVRPSSGRPGRWANRKGRT